MVGFDHRWPMNGSTTTCGRGSGRGGLMVAGRGLMVMAATGAGVFMAAGPRPAVAQAPQAAVSFSRDIAPLLVSRCGGCHVAGRKGGFQMASHDGLMRTGMVQPGVANASRLVEVILSGDMPRGGGKVSPDEMDRLMRWINAGAPCDAPNPTVGLDVLARAGAAAAPMPAPVTRPKLRPGDVSFASDIAPVLMEHCGNCHGETDPEGNLRMTTMQTLLRGGRTGKAITPGQGKGSLIAQKLRGTAEEGDRMPLGQPPLPDDVIAAIEKWIDQGAVLDVLGPADPLEAVAAAGRARSLDDASLFRTRAAAAVPVWRQAIPDEEPMVAARRRLMFAGNLPPERLVAVADDAEKLEVKIRDELVEGDDQPLLKGGMVVFLFAKPYDYSAFWQQIGGRERPRGLSAHAGIAGDVVYAAVLTSGLADDALDTQLVVAEQMAAAALAGRGMPDWFASGAGRSIAMRLVPRAPLVKEWKQGIAEAVAAIGSPKDFTGGHADPAAVATAAGSFVGTLAPPARLKRLVAAVDGGQSFEEAFAATFRGTPESLFTAWAARQKPRRR